MLHEILQVKEIAIDNDSSSSVAENKNWFAFLLGLKWIKCYCFRTEKTHKSLKQQIPKSELIRTIEQLPKTRTYVKRVCRTYQEIRTKNG